MKETVPICNCTPEGDIARERRPTLHQEHCAILKWWNAKNDTSTKETVSALVTALRDQPDVAVEVIEALVHGFGRQLQDRFDREFGQGSLAEGAGIDVRRVLAVFAAACAWRDSARVDRRFLAGASDLQETQLITAVDAAKAARKESSS